MWLFKANQRNIYKIFETLNYPFISPSVHLEKSYKISKTPQDSDEMVMERKWEWIEPVLFPNLYSLRT